MRCIVLANVSLCFFFYSAGVDFQLVNQFSLFEFHWSNAVQQNSIHHQFNGLGKDHSSYEFGPASQDPFSFCQIQFALNTVW
jgi:hypothetical protein